MERALNITENYLHLIRNGARRAVDPELRRKLHQATGLSIFEPILQTTEQLPTNSAPEKKELAVVPYSQTPGLLPQNLPDLLESSLKKLRLTLRLASEKYGIPMNTLKKYKQGSYKPVSEKNITAVTKILEDAKNVQELPPEGVEKIEKFIDTQRLTQDVKVLRAKVDDMLTILSTTCIHPEISNKPASNDAEDRARYIMKLLLALSAELEFFKSCSEEGRKIFKKIVPGQDVGYITTLLRALYDEDKFQRWLLFSTYTMKGKEDGAK
jgi:hypothetical protein